MLSEEILSPSEAKLCCLSDVSPKDKPWDVHKSQSEQIRDLYAQSGFSSYAYRIDNCASFLQFAYNSDNQNGELKLKLYGSKFCRCRHCPTCQWRRVIMWVTRLTKAIPAVLEDHPDSCFIFLTLTIKNCQVDKLRDNLTWMNKSWELLTKRKQFPAKGFVKSTEVTRGKDNTAHPHFHCLLLVPKSYFVGRKYLSQDKWASLWQSCLKINYYPQVDIRRVKPKPGMSELEGLKKAIKETIKYSIKPEDLINSSPEWIEEITIQLHKTRAISLGGIFKDYLREEEPENLITESGQLKQDSDNTIVFGWRERLGRYTKLDR